MTRGLRSTFVFPNPRAQLLARIARGEAPDSTLFGANHLEPLGIAARVYDPLLTRRALRPPLDRVVWNLRELMVPFEIGRTDVLVTPVANLVPSVARVRRLPVVVLNYGLNLVWRRADRTRRAVLGRSLRTAARVVFFGGSQRAELVEAASLRDERTLVLPLPVDASFFTPREAAESGEVLTVGKDLSRDYATFADAVRGLDAPVRLAVFPRNLAGVDLPPNAQAGVLSPVELRDSYAAASCIVLPQHPDGYPYGSEGGGLTALLEAMAMGKAVVLTEREIFADYVSDGVDALVVPPGDPGALRSAIERVLGDRELAARLGAAARTRVERTNSTSGFAERLAPVLRSVV